MVMPAPAFLCSISSSCCKGFSQATCPGSGGAIGIVTAGCVADDFTGMRLPGDCASVMCPGARKTSIRLRHNSDTVGLLQTGCAALDHIQRRFAQKARTVFPRGFLGFPYRFLGYDQFPDFIIEQQYLGTGVTPPVTAAAALAAAFAATESEGFGAVAVDTGFRDQFIAWAFVNST